MREPNAQKFKACDVVTRYAMQLSLTEIGLGSLLHAFHIPFSGFFLSLNQCFVLNRALAHSCQASSWDSSLPMVISNTTAIMKTLSPFGKKFIPMLAISMQGVLFSVGTIIFGNNLWGRCIGSMLLSLWPMIQPTIIYGIIYSGIFLNMIEYYNPIIAKSFVFGNMTLQIAVLGFIGAHIVLSLAVCLLAYALPTAIVDSYELFLISYNSPQSLSEVPKHTFRQKLKGVLKDLTSPIFLASLLLSAFFFYATLHSLGAFFFAFFRLIAIAFLTFFLIRNIPTKWCIGLLSKLYFFRNCAPYVEEILLRIRN